MNCTEQEYVMREHFFTCNFFFFIVTVCLNRHFFFLHVRLTSLILFTAKKLQLFCNVAFYYY